MATQTDVQQLIQSLVPGAVNNGNPNTVYNNSPSSLPPMMDANGNWFLPNLPSAASVQGLQRPAISATIGGSLGGPWTNAGSVLGPLLPTIPTGPWTGQPPPGNPNPPPLQPPPVQPPVPGTQPPPNNPGQGGNGDFAPRFPNDPLGNIFGGQPNTHLPATIDPSWNPLPWITSQGPGGTGGIFGQGGNGGTSWQQILDMITEPILPGNLYHSGTEKWSGTGTALAGLDALLGQGAGWLAQQMGSATNADWFNNYMKALAENSMANNQKDLQNKTNSRVQQDIQRILDEMSGNSSSGGTGRDSRSGRSAGSSTLAEGKAAQDMVAAMQLQAFLTKYAQQARGAMNPRYKLEF